VDETGRMVSLAVATLLANGAAEPRRHLFLAASGNIATLVMSKSPLSPAALAALKDAAKTHEFPVLLSPDSAAPTAELEKIVSAKDRSTLDQATAGFHLDLTPPTDARPFFFNQLTFFSLFDADVLARLAHAGVVAGNLVATLTLTMLVLISLVLVGATIVVPLQSTVRETGWELAVGGTVYFALIGIGFSAWHRSACGLPGPASSWSGGWRAPATCLHCRSGCRRSSPASMEQAFSFVPASVFLSWRRQAS